MKLQKNTKKRWIYYSVLGVALALTLGAVLLPPSKTSAQSGSPGVYTPVNRAIEPNATVNVREIAARDALTSAQELPWLNVIPAPKGTPPVKNSTVPIATAGGQDNKNSLLAPAPSATGSSPGPVKTFKGEFLSSTSIPPDTMGAVGTTHVITVSNDRMRIQDRSGVELSRATITSFWTGTTIKGAAVTSAFDTKVFFDRYNGRFILISSLNGPGVNSGAGVAVTQTADPTGTWNRFTFASDVNATGGSGGAGHAIDYPSVGISKNWIVVDENTFSYTCTTTTPFPCNFTSYYGQQIFVLDKQAAYNNTLSSIPLFEGTNAACAASATQQTELGCGFTMAPAVTEDNTTTTDYLAEDWDNTAGQLRLSKITGTPAAPILTVGTQFPQSALSWRFDAARIGTTGGYAPQRQQSLNATSGTRIANNDSRIQNTVYRNGSLWAAHHVMVAATPTAAGTAVGGTTNPDVRSAIQWWQINPTIENSAVSTPALQRARIEDPIADNCHNGSSGTRTTGTCVSTATQVGEFFAFPNISVNRNNDVFIGFTQFSALSYPSAAYAIRLSSDPVNTIRDTVVFHPGQANYNLGSGTGGTTARNNRWGDYSAAQTDPLNDVDFWTVQEYAGTVRDFGIGLAGNWETWWAEVKPGNAAPSTTGSLIINEFRLRGPQGVRDEFVELYNPGTTPVIVNTTDGSDGWALAYSTAAGVVSGVAVVPNGTVVPPRGHFLIADNPDAANGPTLVYSLNSYAGVTNPAANPPGIRGADSDTGWSFDLADNGGLALFKTSTAANFNAANRLDSVGFAGVTNALYFEGTGIPAITTQPTTNFSYYRNNASGTPQDTGNNAADFVFVDVSGASPSAGVRNLGAPGPQNLDSPVQRGAQVPVALIDSTVAADVAPNQVRDLTSDPANNSTNGTVAVRRNVTNNTGEAVARLRFRITSLSTFPNAMLDLRLRTSTAVVVSSSDPLVCGANPVPCSVTAQGLTLEEPPAQALGGGLNSSVAALSVTLANPIPAGGKIQVNFLFGVQTGNPFSAPALISRAKSTGKNLLFAPQAPQAPVAFGVDAEAFTFPTLSPTAAAVSIRGQVLTADGKGIDKAIVRMIDPNGKSTTVLTNPFGYYQLNGVKAGVSYVFTVDAKRYKFYPRISDVTSELTGFNFVATK